MVALEYHERNTHWSLETSTESDQEGHYFVTAHNVVVLHLIITSSGKCEVGAFMNLKISLVGVENILFIQYAFKKFTWKFTKVKRDIYVD